MIIIIWLAAKYSQRLLYVILGRSGTQKNKGEISPPLWEISRVFLEKGKKSIDLESVVVWVIHKDRKKIYLPEEEP